MAKPTIEITNDSTENTRIFGSVENVIEYCRARLNENFTATIHGSYEYESVVQNMKAQLYANLSNIRVR